MSTSSLPAIPTELLAQIFKSTDSFATATALSSTSRRFRSIWKTHSPSICYAVLVRTIPCYDQAFDYVKAQPPDATSSEQIRDTDLLAINLTKQFCGNAEIACLALRHYETQMIARLSVQTPGPSSLTEAQRKSFLRAWYRIHTLASGPTDPLPYDKLASLNLLEFEQMMEALRWLMYYCPNEHRTELRISFQLGALEGDLWSRRLPKSPISAKHWNDLITRLGSLRQDLYQSPLNHRCPNCGELFFWQFMAHEFCLEVKGSGKGVSLADMLPLIRERKAPDQLYKLSSWGQVGKTRRMWLSW
ncbi:hypothetical protein HO173_004937 [Letharia columbiana]|uniref:F-box domain-containing protein n=1 Tax=Letharia columbiana TaxID=112416 RepID=A0A8H6FXM9_9LECA|nr:uncharacterized protein HO173_004937 [Letharia columbiana]KAF6236646.1 hypothetical protein HO173_004937 [Letharia columbiana]